MKILLVGGAAVEQSRATARDLLASEVAEGWLVEAGHVVTSVREAATEDEPSWADLNPEQFEAVLVVSGEVRTDNARTQAFLDRFAGCRLIGLDLTMTEPPGERNPFDALYERSSPLVNRPDLAFASTSQLLPVVGLALSNPEHDGIDRDETRRANAVLELIASECECAPFRIEPLLDLREQGMTSAAQVSSLIAKTDVVLTTRADGLVLALLRGVPVVAVDPTKGGSLSRQAQWLRWAWCFPEGTPAAPIAEALGFCLQPESRSEARAAARRAKRALSSVRRELRAELVRFDAGVPPPD